MKNEKLIFTISVSLITFLFIGFLVYVIYCYGYYDSKNESTLLEIYNKKKFDDLYDNLYNKDKTTKEEYETVISLMYDETNLEKIYNTYYQNNSEYPNLKSFIETYYYGDNKIDKNNIEYEKEGKTTLNKRATTYIKNIQVSSQNGTKSELGIAEDIKLIIDSKGSLKLDNKIINCVDETCSIEKIYKGIHEIMYSSNGFTYYGLLNIKDEKEITITNNESLVTIDAKNIGQKIQKGYYYLKKCYLESNCPSNKSSYIHIIDDYNVELNNYLPTEIANDYYKGTYTIENGFLIMNFNSHIYNAYDYDTSSKTDIVTTVDMQIRYKIIDSENLLNDEYHYGYTK